MRPSRQGPPSDPEDTYLGYFEIQEPGFARCGLHAINNALGSNFFTPHDMTDACTAFLQESHFEHLAEIRSAHERPTGWYSEAAMAYVFRWYTAEQALGQAFAYKLDLDNPILAHRNPNRIYERRTAGIVVNQNQEHGVTLKFHNNHIWLLDSMHRPTRLTFEAYLAFLVSYRRAYALLNEGALD